MYSKEEEYNKDGSLKGIGSERYKALVTQQNQNRGNREVDSRPWEGVVTRYELMMGKEAQEVSRRIRHNQEQQLTIQTMESLVENLTDETHGHYPNLRKVLEKRVGIQSGRDRQVLRLCETEDKETLKRMEWESHDNTN